MIELGWVECLPPQRRAPSLWQVGLKVDCHNRIELCHVLLLTRVTPWWCGMPHFILPFIFTFVWPTHQASPPKVAAGCPILWGCLDWWESLDLKPWNACTSQQGGHRRTKLNMHTKRELKPRRHAESTELRWGFISNAVSANGSGTKFMGFWPPPRTWIRKATVY